MHRASRTCDGEELTIYRYGQREITWESPQTATFSHSLFSLKMHPKDFGARIETRKEHQSYRRTSDPMTPNTIEGLPIQNMYFLPLSAAGEDQKTKPS